MKTMNSYIWLFKVMNSYIWVFKHPNVGIHCLHTKHHLPGIFESSNTPLRPTTPLEWLNLKFSLKNPTPHKETLPPTPMLKRNQTQKKKCQRWGGGGECWDTKPEGYLWTVVITLLGEVGTVIVLLDPRLARRNHCLGHLFLLKPNKFNSLLLVLRYPIVTLSTSVLNVPLFTRHDLLCLLWQSSPYSGILTQFTYSLTENRKFVLLHLNNILCVTYFVLGIHFPHMSVYIVVVAVSARGQTSRIRFPLFNISFFFHIRSNLCCTWSCA
jgi:hypothetical protein